MNNLTIKSIASSSLGNCYTVDDGQTKILIECGIPIKKIKKGERIVDALGPLVRQNLIRIHSRNEELLTQMDRFTGQEGDDDDLIDSLSMIVYVVPSFAPHRNLPEQFKRAGWTIREIMERSRRKKKGWEGRFKK